MKDETKYFLRLFPGDFKSARRTPDSGVLRALTLETTFSLLHAEMNVMANRLWKWLFLMSGGFSLLIITKAWLFQSADKVLEFKAAWLH